MGQARTARRKMKCVGVKAKIFSLSVQYVNASLECDRDEAGEAGAIPEGLANMPLSSDLTEEQRAMDPRFRSGFLPADISF